MLVDHIKEQQLAARKQKDTVKINVLTTLLGEIMIIGKNDGNRVTTDDEATKAIIKFHKNIKETISLQKSRNHSCDVLEQELAIVDTFMPQQLSEFELTSIISATIAELNIESVKEMGKIMKHIGNQYKGMYDGPTCKRLIDAYFGTK
jgi:uncharacterized protein YqeY